MYAVRASVKKIETMTLSTFIRVHMAQIVAEWTTFAKKTAPEDGDLSELALADHAAAILEAVASDLETGQNAHQQFEKSQGQGAPASSAESAAAIHGRTRQADNFSMLQLSSEFRALRATVLRLWLAQSQPMSATTMQEMVRFNEAIDQALAESIATYVARADRARELFLAVLGHDLRAPLANIALSSELLTGPGVTAEKLSALAQNAKRNSMLMSTMVTDLLGYARLQMRAGIPIKRASVDVLGIVEAALADAQAMYPKSVFEFKHAGELTGSFDDIRLRQLITNLLINAAQYSMAGAAVQFDVDGKSDCIAFSVRNRGPVIPEADLQTIFQALVQLDPDGHDTRPRTSLGLGLFIAKETALAHHGTIHATSNAADGTTFAVVLPRHADADNA